MSAKLLWYPGAETKHKTVTKGKFRKGHPEGAVVHFTAGHCETDQDMINSIDGGRRAGFAFWGIGPSGKVFQTHALDSWGHHAGTSRWPELGSSVSKYLLGIEIAAAGRLESNGKSWFGKTYEKDRIRTVKAQANMKAGSYVKYSEAQERALIDLLIWLKGNSPDFSFDLVLGHDEVAPDRKDDPGGALSMTMPELRALLKSQFPGPSGT